MQNNKTQEGNNTKYLIFFPMMLYQSLYIHAYLNGWFIKLRSWMAKIHNLELKLESQTYVVLNALRKSYLSSLDNILIIVSLKWSKVF